MADAYDPHGAAMIDYLDGKTDALLTCHQDGRRDDVPAAFWFRTEIGPLEARALELARGCILDIGAGSGVHALELQRRGHNVTAIDVVPACVEIMRRRGVTDARLADLYAFEEGPFDTLLCICNGLDKVGRLAELPRFLARMAKLLAPGGQLLADSFDLRIGAAPERLAELARKTANGRYFGEMDLRFEYADVQGEPFEVLHVDAETLVACAAEGGWRADILERRGGQYLARLTRPDDHA